MIAGFGTLFSGMFVLIGFVLRYRRTTVAPAVNEIEELKQKERAIEEVFKVYARKDLKFKEAMRVADLL